MEVVVLVDVEGAVEEEEVELRVVEVQVLAVEVVVVVEVEVRMHCIGGCHFVWCDHFFLVYSLRGCILAPYLYHTLSSLVPPMQYNPPRSTIALLRIAPFELSTPMSSYDKTTSWGLAQSKSLCTWYPPCTSVVISSYIIALGINTYILAALEKLQQQRNHSPPCAG